jgi:hypothetical protein
MLAVPLVGALLVLCGVVYTARVAIFHGRSSDPRPDPDDAAIGTLEPQDRGIAFPGVRASWPGLLMMAVGSLMLLLPPLA